MEENPGSENSSETAKSDTSNAGQPTSTDTYQSFERYVSDQRGPGDLGQLGPSEIRPLTLVVPQ
jgi:hypothetical protein